MSDVVKSFGNNAGKIWEILYKEGPQVQSKLMKKARLRSEEFYGAIGWLARENKIYKDKRTYKLGDTNLTEKIGKDAGLVWKLLGRSNGVDVTGISRLANIPKYDCYSALGWLGREGKITARITIRKR